MGGEPSCDGAGVTVSAAGYFAGIGVRHPGVLLGINNPHTDNFWRSTSTLWELSVVGVAAVRSIIKLAVTDSWMGTSSTNNVVHMLHL
jgi:hypothetical protein